MMDAGDRNKDGKRVVILAGAALSALVLLVSVFAAAPRGFTGTSAVASSASSKCKKIKSAPARRNCQSLEIQRVKPPVPVDVRDDFYFPDSLTIKAGRRISWDWGTTNGNAHDLVLESGPKSLSPAERYGLGVRESRAINYRFTRSLTKVGTYSFYCNLHSGVMAMNVRVTK